MSDEKIKNDANQQEEQEQNHEMNPENPVQEASQNDANSQGDQESEDYLMQLKRVQAEFVNFKKRNEKRFNEIPAFLYLTPDILA